MDLASDYVLYRGMCRQQEQSMYHTTSALGEMLIKRLGAVDESGVFVVMMNNRHELVRIVPTNCGTNSLYNIDKNQLVRDIIESHASIAILARLSATPIAVLYAILPALLSISDVCVLLILSVIVPIA